MNDLKSQFVNEKNQNNLYDDYTIYVYVLMTD